MHTGEGQRASPGATCVPVDPPPPEGWGRDPSPGPRPVGGVPVRVPQRGTERPHDAEDRAGAGLLLSRGGGEEGRGFWTQNLVYQKWPDQNFPIVNFVFSHDGHFGLGGGEGVLGEGSPPPWFLIILKKPWGGGADPGRRWPSGARARGALGARTARNVCPAGLVSRRRDLVFRCCGGLRP